VLLTADTPVPPPNGGTFTNFTAAPTIGPNGHVAFRGTYSGGVGGGTGLFTWNGTTLADVARTNGPPAPGTTFNFALNNFGSLYVPVDANGRIAFTTGYGDGTSGGTGVFTNVSGTLATVARTNPATSAPGSGGAFTGFSDAPPTLTPGGQLAFRGDFDERRQVVNRGRTDFWNHAVGPFFDPSVRVTP
jgi:hypothetical protein